MKGLIYRDMVAFFRRTSRLSWFFDIVFMLFFLFLIKGPIAVQTYVIFVQPVNMSGTASTLKEIDTNYSGRFSLTLPASHSQQVLSRFASSFLLLLLHLPETIVFILLHYMIYHQYEPAAYLFYLAIGLVISVIMNIINVVTSFAVGLNAAAIFYFIMVLAALAVYMAYWFLDFDLLALLQMSSLQLLGAAASFAVVLLLAGYQIAKKLYLRKLG